MVHVGIGDWLRRRILQSKGNGFSLCTKQHCYFFFNVNNQYSFYCDDRVNNNTKLCRLSYNNRCIIKSDGLSGGEIAGIVVGGGILVFGAVYWVHAKHCVGESVTISG